MGARKRSKRPSRPDAFLSMAKNHSKRRKVMMEVAEKMGVKTMEDWRRVTHRDVQAVRGGAALLRMHSYSITDILRDTFPEEVFDERLCRPTLPRRYWESSENARKFLDSLAAAHDIKEAEDWRRISPVHMVEAGGSGLLRRNSNSVLEVLRAVYGDSFRGQPLTAVTTRPVITKRDWEANDNLKTFLESLKTANGVKKPEDWFRLSTAQIWAVPGGRSFLANNDLRTALKKCYPTENWDSFSSRAPAKRATQRMLFFHVENIFAPPGHAA